MENGRSKQHANAHLHYVALATVHQFHIEVSMFWSPDFQSFIIVATMTLKLNLKKICFPLLGWALACSQFSSKVLIINNQKTSKKFQLHKIDIHQIEMDGKL